MHLTFSGTKTIYYDAQQSVYGVLWGSYWPMILYKYNVERIWNEISDTFKFELSDEYATSQWWNMLDW